MHKFYFLLKLFIFVLGGFFLSHCFSNVSMSRFFLSTNLLTSCRRTFCFNLHLVCRFRFWLWLPALNIECCAIHYQQIWALSQRTLFTEINEDENDVKLIYDISSCESNWIQFQFDYSQIRRELRRWLWGMETQRSNWATISYCPAALPSSASYVTQRQKQCKYKYSTNTKKTTREKTNAKTVQCDGCEIISYCPAALLSSASYVKQRQRQNKYRYKCKY